ncbi:MAG: HEAT repeat domain-containing protein [Sedimentisphaerales bacterium]|nr:HEAT repeat domain-containing protein [Sedimentisphaerales bacterium]
MNSKVVVILCCFLLTTFVSAVSADTLEDDWNDFLHYTVIGRFDLASGFAQKIIESKPDPLALLELSEKNPRGYAIVTKVHSTNPELAPLAAKILDIIEAGRFARRSDSEIILAEIKRLSSTVRGKYTAIERLRNAGEYAIPYMLDALADENRKSEFANITSALGEIGRAAIRPLTASLAMDNPAVKGEVIKALGKIGYPESLGYLKYIAENDSSDQLRQLAADSMRQIDSTSLNKSAAQLFYEIADNYYYKSDSVSISEDANTANIWFWDNQAKALAREGVDKAYFYELMAMRCCEWSLKADPDFGSAIATWIAAFFRVEKTGLDYPKYFGPGHPDAMTYATTLGPEYLHQALARGVRDKDDAVALGTVEALAKNAGEKSLMYMYKTSQPLVDALRYDNRAVKFTAAIAIALAGPVEKFRESEFVAQNLAEAVTISADESWPQDTADLYAFRACQALLELAQKKNKVIDLSLVLPPLVAATVDTRDEIKIFAANILAYLSSPDAQRAVAEMAVNEEIGKEIRLAAFDALATSAKVNGNLLLDEQVDKIYSILQFAQADPDLRASAAAAFGALNLPSRKAKELILNQAKI